MSDRPTTADLARMDAIEHQQVNGCPRCGFDHNDLTFHVLLNGVEYCYWTMCPVVNQPILCNFEGWDDDATE